MRELDPNCQEKAMSSANRIIPHNTYIVGLTVGMRTAGDVPLDPLPRR